VGRILGGFGLYIAGGTDGGVGMRGGCARGRVLKDVGGKMVVAGSKESSFRSFAQSVSGAGLARWGGLLCWAW